MDFQEYARINEILNTKILELPQSGIEFKFGKFKCSQGVDDSGARCLWCRNAEAQCVGIDDFIAIYQQTKRIRNTDMPVEDIFELLELLPSIESLL